MQQAALSVHKSTQQRMIESASSHSMYLTGSYPKLTACCLENTAGLHKEKVKACYPLAVFQ
jgi:hypothetical protein